MTLTELFDRNYLPHLQNYDRTDKTIAEYRNSLKYWEIATGGTVNDNGRITGGVQVEDITEKTIVAFKKYLRVLPGKAPGTTMADNTIRKHLRQIWPLLATAAPRDTRNRRGLGLIAEMPELAPPTEFLRDAVDAFTREEIVAWIAAARARRARPVSGVPSPLWWECLLKFIYNTGVRIGTAVQIRWDWIDFDDRTIRIEKEAGVKSAYSIPLNDEAVEVLETIRQASGYTGPDDRVFRWEMNPRTLYRHASGQMKAAGFPEHRWFKFHAIRKHVGSELASENSAAATKALGHSNPTVTTRYYMNSKRIVAPAVQRIRPLGRAADAVPLSVPTAVPSTPINHVENDFGLFGCVINVYR